jgi:hypothetical protein
MHVRFIHWFIVVRLKGSTLLTNGVITDGSDEWAIYGGTGVFAMATGVIRRRFLAGSNDGNSDELTSIEVFCPAFGSAQQQPNKQVRSVYMSEKKSITLLRMTAEFSVTQSAGCTHVGLRLCHQDWGMGWRWRVGAGHHDDGATTASAQPLRSNWFCRRLHRVHVY